MLIALGAIVWIVLAVFALRGARWAYAVFVLLGFLWIPARTGFHFHPPKCELLPSFDLALYSLLNYKHVFLFGVFFVMTRVQLGNRRHALLMAFAATLVMGVLIELEETLTRTGHCRLRDLVPDSAGAAIGVVIWRVWRGRESAPSSR